MKRLFLIGFMGSGKTTIGNLLAKNLEYSFIDLDVYIESRMRKKITDIFAESGEDEFREIEHKMLLEVSSLENVVVSTGGGTPCFYDNMEIMNETGLSLYLKLSNESLSQRLNKARAFRPLIKDKSDSELIDFIKETLTKREIYYTRASLIVNNDGNDPNIVCKEIISQLKKPAQT